MLLYLFYDITDVPSIKPDHTTWNVSSTVLIQFSWTLYFSWAVFRFRFIACIQIQSFSERFIFLHLSTFTKVGFSWKPRSEKTLTLVLFRARALQSFYFYVFLQGACKPCNKPETSGHWTHKYHKTALSFITHFLHWTFVYLLSLIGIFFRYLFVLTYYDVLRWPTRVTT